MKKRIMLLFCLLCLTFNGCGQSEQAKEESQFTVSGGPNVNEVEKGTLTLSMRIPETLNPLLNREETVDRILKLLFLPVLEFEESGKPVPAVAQSWELSADGMAATLQLDPNIKWHDGTALTADDVVFSLNLLRNAPEDAVYKRVLQYVSGCQAVGEHTVVFTFHTAFSGNLLALRFPVLPQHYYAGQTDPKSNINMNPVGSGAYHLQSYTQALELMLEANPSYYKGAPQIPFICVKITAGKETDINAFEQGMTDVLVADAMEAGRYIDETLSGIYPYTSYEYDFIGFNFRNPLLQDKTVRQAVAYALPKQTLLESVYLNYGEMTNTPISPKSWLYEENVAPYHYDLSMAGTVLKNSGWTDLDGDKKLERMTESGGMDILQATILVNQENTARRQIASKLKEELEAIGFRIIIDQQPFALYQERLLNGQFDMIVGGWKCSEMTDLSPFFATGGSLNYIGYSNAEVDALLSTAYAAVGEGQTVLAYSSLQKKLAEELPYISIAYRNQAVFASRYVGGTVTPTDFNIYHGIEAWTYEKKAGK